MDAAYKRAAICCSLIKIIVFAAELMVMWGSCVMVVIVDGDGWRVVSWW